MSLESIRHVQPQDPVAAQITSQPTRALEVRLKRLEDAVAAAPQEGTQLLIRNAKVKVGTSAVQPYDVVFYNATTGQYEKALAAVTTQDDTFTPNASSQAAGIVWGDLHADGTADILIGGYGVITPANSSAISAKIDPDGTFVSGAIYYLSSKTPGKVTRFAPNFKVQVYVAGKDTISVNPAYGSTDMVDIVYRTVLGMRPVGSLREAQDGKVQIVAFDAIETTLGGYQSTLNSLVDTCRDYGYVVADATVDIQPQAPVYVRLTAGPGDSVTVKTFPTFLDAGAGSNQLGATISTSIAALAASAQDFPIYGTDAVKIGTLSAKLTTADMSVVRDVFFKFPDSFQGWKMTNPPSWPGLSDTTITNGGKYYQSAPAVTFSTGDRAPTSTATGTAAMSDFQLVSIERLQSSRNFLTLPSLVVEHPTGTTKRAAAVSLSGLSPEGSPANLFPKIPDSAITDGGTGFVPNRIITDVSVVSGGSGGTDGASYTYVVPGCTFWESGTAPVIGYTISGGSITSAAWNYQGTHVKTIPDTVVIADNNLSGAAIGITSLATPLVGVDLGFTVTASGAMSVTVPTTTAFQAILFSSAPLAVIHSSTGSGAVLHVALSGGTNGYITAITPYIGVGGTGYTTADKVGVVGGGVLTLEASVGRTVQSITLGSTGNYIQAPTITFTGGSDDYRFVPATATPVMTADAYINTGLQITTHGGDFDSGSVVATKPVNNTGPFYYNAKADYLFRLRWPSVPVERTTVLENGLELLSSRLNETTGAFADSYCDVGLSPNTLYWTTAYPDSCPWDRNYVQFALAPTSTGDDHILFGDWRWWEQTHQTEPYRNRGWIYVNRTSRYHTSGRVSSLSVQSPLRLTDVTSGIDSSQNGNPMTGQLQLTLDDRAAIFSAESQQVDFAKAGRTAIWLNNTGHNVLISSVVLASVFQSVVTGQTVQATNSAKISVGTASGGYNDIIGASAPVDTCLIQAGRYKELFPDAGTSIGIVAPGDSVYVNVQTPAGSPILSQTVTVRVKGHAL